MNEKENELAAAELVTFSRMTSNFLGRLNLASLAESDACQLFAIMDRYRNTVEPLIKKLTKEPTNVDEKVRKLEQRISILENKF
jgi:hypothetical protein